MPGHQHRAGSLRQTNKKNKRSKASKRSLSRAAGGKVVGGKANAAQNTVARNKAERKNLAAQKRDLKRQELLRKKRGFGRDQTPPRVVGIVSLGADTTIEERLRSFIVKNADRVTHPHKDKNATVTCIFEYLKKDGQLTVLTSSTAFPRYEDNEDGAVMRALDLARVCDLLVFVLNANEPAEETDLVGMNIGDDVSHSTSKTNNDRNFEHLVTSRGDRILTALKAQGLPTPLTVLAHTEKDDLMEDYMTMQSFKSVRRSSIKRHLEIRKFASRFAETEFGSGHEKVVECNLHEADSEDVEDSEQLSHARKKHNALFVRTLCTIACSPPRWIASSPRTYILSDLVDVDRNRRELRIRGYVRGAAPFDVNSLIHVPNLGTGRCVSVKRLAGPLHRLAGKDTAEESPLGGVLQADPQLQESLNMYATPDALEGEQNLIGFETEDNYDQDLEQAEEKFARPTGWSDYQAAWLDAVDEEDVNGDHDFGELADELNQKEDTKSLGMDIEEANDVSMKDKKALAEERRKEKSDHDEFPDEVDVEEDMKARDRFARYRAIKSFRKSYWDPKESLPESYATIFGFSSFKATQRSIMKDFNEVCRASDSLCDQFFGKSPDNNDMDDRNDADDILEGFVPSRIYVEATLAFGEISTSIESAAAKGLLVAVSLLPHENKVSVLHTGLSQSIGCDTTENPIKSKDVLTFRCGWRTWQGRPIFSQNNLNCDKHKFERFMPLNGAFFAASVFGPVTYTPCPVLVFRENDSGRRELVAVGSMIGADADRIVLKRIILTGYPVRVHKRSATVKYMFYDPEDVKWFKPAGLYTKHGLEGNIVESVGDHGTMKCLFNAPIKQHDTVCLPLYKRVYPKYAPDDSGKESGVVVL